LDEDSKKRRRIEQEKPDETEQRKRKRQRPKGDQRRNQKESMDELMKSLQMRPDDIDKGHVVSEKDFPETATDFFDQIGAWYTSVVASKQQQLDKQTAKPHMYQ